MKKLILLASLFCFSSYTAYCQSPTKYNFSVKSEFKHDSRSIPEEYIGSANDMYYFLYSDGKYGQGKTSLVEFDSNLIPTSRELEINDSQNFPNRRSSGNLYFKDKIVNISSEKESDYLRLFAKTITLESLWISSDETIADISLEGENMKKASFFLFQSPDSTKLGLVYFVPPKKDNDLELYVQTYNDKLEIIEKEKYSIPNYLSIAEGVFKEGSELILLLYNPDNIPKGDNLKQPFDYQYQIVSLSKGQVKSISKFDNVNKWLHNISLEVNENLIEVVGVYSSFHRYDVQGSFFHQANTEESQQPITTFSPFSKQLLEEHIAKEYVLKSLRNRIKKRSELPYYILHSVLPYDDGSKLVLLEQSHIVSMNYVTTFNSEDILAFKIDNQGNIEWEKVIKKDNSKIGTWFYSSFIVLEQDNENHVLIYNGNSENIKQDASERLNAFTFPRGEESITLVEINKNGSIHKHGMLFEEEIDGYRIRPGLTVEVDENKYMLFSQQLSNVKKQRYYEFSIEE